MCYAIPGKIIDINGSTAHIDYFGEKKEAYVDVEGVNPGDYVFAQGGVIVERLEEDIALSILSGWNEAFFKLKEIDRRLTEEESVYFTKVDENPSPLPSPLRGEGWVRGGFSDETFMLHSNTKDNENREAKATSTPGRGDFSRLFSGETLQIIDKAEIGLSLTKAELLLLLKIKEEGELKLLYNAANRIRHKVHKNSSCVHGIIEFSNICKNDCAYCGIRRENQRLERYRMEIDEIVAAVISSISNLGFRAYVLQGGEDGYYTTDKLAEIIRKIKERCNVLIFISIGERERDCYQKLYNAGARGVLFRFETSNLSLYGSLHSTLYYENRLRILMELKEIGYIIATGSLIGLPGQKEEDILDDILLASSLEPEMYSFGPFIPHPDTPLALAPKVDINMMLKVIAVTRLVRHDGNILVTSALEKLFGIEGTRRALMTGGNSMMVNLTPQRYRRLYSIYPGKGDGNDDTRKRISDTVALLQSLGRAPMDIGMKHL
ncbi:MAG: [FeFe] hydrogenase H-cluster radical SAM maturase HydE [Nitrospirae bacterium]|nr:[FeFe] hydrogenase H-cluster radical SAM maturase HydE [Nitrospirota bacterium]